MLVLTARPCGNLVVCQAQKARNVKVNERGKVASRPGPISPKEAKKQAQQQQQQQQLIAQQQQQQQQQEQQPPQQQAADAQPSSATPSGSKAAQPQPSAPQQQPPVRQNGPTETPQVVVDRIFARMVACAGVPVAVGILLLVGIYFLKKQGGDDFPMWPAYVSQVLTLVGGLLGISYGALSASWDPTREGSLMGWTEFQANLPIFLSRDNNNSNRR